MTITMLNIQNIIKSKAKPLTEEYMRNHIHKLNWTSISSQQKLSEDFIRDFQNKFDKMLWLNLSADQVLSEEFILEFQDKVCWSNISRFQKLSEEFILNNLDKLTAEHLLENDNITLSEDIKLLIQIKQL